MNKWREEKNGNIGEIITGNTPRLKVKLYMAININL